MKINLILLIALLLISYSGYSQRLSNIPLKQITYSDNIIFKDSIIYDSKLKIENCDSNGVIISLDSDYFLIRYKGVFIIYDKINNVYRIKGSDTVKLSAELNKPSLNIIKSKYFIRSKFGFRRITSVNVHVMYPYTMWAFTYSSHKRKHWIRISNRNTYLINAE